MRRFGGAGGYPVRGNAQSYDGRRAGDGLFREVGVWEYLLIDRNMLKWSKEG